MLTAGDILVSLVGNRVSLGLDAEGVAITNLGTAYDAASGVLTITAATTGTISAAVPIPGISIDKQADTISVNLKALPRFAGVSVVGGAGTDSITIGRGGVNLAAVTRGAAAQGVSIDTGAGTADAIVVTGPIVTKGAGGVNLLTQGMPAMHGILLAAGTRSPAGSQTFAGAVTLLGDVAIRAGGNISFSSTVDGAGRLQLFSGRAITLAGDVGGVLPLQGVTLATAGRVTVGRGLFLEGAGTAAGTSGLVVGAGVHNVVFSEVAATRTISGFSGAGIRFLGSSQGSRLTGVTSTGNGVGIRLGPGSYAHTVITGSSFTGNSAAGVSLVSARGVTIGGAAPGAGNSIVSNGGFGLTAAGLCVGSLVVGNEIGDNPLGQVEDFLAGRLTGTTVTQNATGLRFQLTAVGRASYLAQQSRTVVFDVTFNAFAVSARATGRFDTRTASLDVDAAVGYDAFPSRAPSPRVPQPADLSSNRVVAALTPLKTLPGIEFPKSVLFVGREPGGSRYRAVLGASAFVGILPLADLENVPIAARDDSPVTVDVWINTQGSVSRVGGSFEGGSFDVTLRGDGRAGALSATVAGIPAASARPPAASGKAAFTGIAGGPTTTPTVTPAASGTPVVAASLPAAGAAAFAAGPLLPGSVNGVSGVQVGHSTLAIPYGAGYEAPTDWYFPTQVDGTVAAQGVIWLQHASGATGGAYAARAVQLARQTNSIVVAPTLPSTPPADNPGWWLPGDPMRQAVASLFEGGRSALNASAVAAGYAGRQGPLPGAFVLAGHSTGGGFATAVAAAYVAGNAAATDLLGVIMLDGVSAGAFDGSGRFALQLSELDARRIPVYQIAAPAQFWNAYGATTNALMAARPDRFNGVVLVGGSHVDAMLGGDLRVDLVAQRVTRGSAPGNTAAIDTLGAGWINDLYAGATPDAPRYGVYATASQPIIMGAAAAAALPSPIANTSTLGDRRLAAEIDATGGLFGFVPGPVINAGGNGLSAAVAPVETNGVTGVKTGTAPLHVPCGASGYATTADWYFPTQADGRVAANAVIWLQHGDQGDASPLAPLAAEIARQTNSIVVAPTIQSVETAALPGSFLGSAAMREGVAAMFLGDRGALSISANAAGGRGRLPEKFLLAGYATGGGFAALAGALTVDNGAAADLLGIVMFDGVADSVEFGEAFAKCTSLGVPIHQIAAPPQAANLSGRTTAELSLLMPGQFVGLQIDGVSPADLIPGVRPSGRGVASAAGPTPQEARDAVITIAVGWINDLHAGYGPMNPRFGIYGCPNDGTYMAGQPITMGRVRATVLPAVPPV